MAVDWLGWAALQQRQSENHQERADKQRSEALKATQLRARQDALSAYAAKPEDAQAWQQALAADPELALKLSEANSKRSFNTAMSDYFSVPNANALTQYSRGMNLGPQRNALAPAPASMPAPRASAAEAAGSVPRVSADQPDLSVLGDPQTPRDRAFLRMLQHDPEKAMKIQTGMRDNLVNRVKNEHSFYSMAIDELSRARDEQGWQATLQRLSPYADALGVDLTEHLPGNYPGPDHVDELLRQAMPIKDRLSFFLREYDVNADNERADRNADSLIQDRAARRREAVRYHNQTDATRRRGQDNRVSKSPSRNAGIGRSRPTATGPNGEKVEWNGKQWVPLR